MPWEFDIMLIKTCKLNFAKTIAFKIQFVDLSWISLGVGKISIFPALKKNRQMSRFFVFLLLCLSGELVAEKRELKTSLIHLWLNVNCLESWDCPKLK